VRTWAKWIGRGLLGLLALVLVVIAAGYIFLTSRAGEERILRLAVASARDAFQGSLEAEQLEFGGNHLVLHNVVLRDPDGGLIAEVDTLEVRLSLRTLFRRTIYVRQLTLVAPRVHLRFDDRGFNVARAFQPRNPSPSQPSAESTNPPTLGIVLESLQLRGGAVDLEQIGEGSKRELRIEDLEARASGGYVSPSQKVKVDLQLDGRVTYPTPGPLSLKVREQGSGDHQAAQLALILAGLRVDASAALAGDELQAQLARLELPPNLVSVWVPGYPVLVPISASGEGALSGDVVAAKLELKAGSAAALVEGSLDIAKLQSKGIALQARHINLRELLANGPDSNLEVNVQGRGGGHSVDTLDGRLELVAPESRVRGYSIGPIAIEASARRGLVEVPKLVVDLPGLRLAGAGRGSRRDLSFSGTLRAANLDALSKTLGGIARQPPLKISGSGELQVAVKGSTKHPGVTFNGAFPRLRYDTYAADNLSVRGSVPDVQKPLQSQLSLTAARLALEDRVLKNISVSLTTRGRDLTAEIRSMGFAQLLVRAGATVDADHQGLLLRSLQLQYPEAQWTLQQPARIHFGNGDLSSGPLELRAGSQSIRAAGSLRGKRVSAELQVEGLDLALLPKPVINPDLHLAGVVSAEVRAQGKLPRPAIKARVGLQGGRFKQYDHLELRADASYENDRAVGTANARGLGTSLSADFDAPIDALRMRKREPVRIAVSLEDTAIEQLLRAFNRSDPITGSAAAKIELSGTADEPKLGLALQGRSLRYAESPPVELSVSVQSGEKGKLASSLEWTVRSVKSSVAVQTPLTLWALLQSPPTVESLRSMVVEVDLDVHEFPLELLRDEGLVQEDIRGKVSVRGELRGSARAPVGKVAVSLTSGALGDAPPIDASLIAAASTTSIQASLDAHRENRRLLHLTASIETPPANVKGIADIVDRPLSLNASVGPISIEELRMLLGGGDREDQAERVPAIATGGAATQRSLNGIVRCELSISGNLADPKVDLRSEVEQLAAQKLALGNGKLQYAYRRASSTVSLELASTGGTFTLRGHSELDLSYPALRRGLKYANAPIDLTLTSSQFDLAFLSGVAPPIRKLGGTLDANATVRGTIGVPNVHGKVEWTNGSLALVGFGDFDRIHLLIEGTEEQFQLRELVVHSGAGQAKVIADARRSGRDLSLSGRANLDKFPIIADDQPVAILSLESTLEGEITPEAVNVRRLQIPQAHIELPDIKRKDLQSMDRPDDIVLLRDGVPINKTRYEAATAALTGHEVTSDPKVPAPRASSRQLVVTVDAPRNLWIKGNDANIEIGLSDGFKVELTPDPVVFGEVKILQGRVEVIGRRFDLQKSSIVRFNGPAGNPSLDVLALYNNEREQVKIFVTVRGEVKNLSIKTNSEPPMTETEIYTMLATGHRTLNTNSGTSVTGSQVAVSAIGSLMASQLKNDVAKNLPLDVLSVEAGEHGLAGTKVEAGTYVTDRIYVGYTARINANPDLGQNANEVRVYYLITNRWSLQATYGDAKVGSADIIWSRDY